MKLISIGSGNVASGLRQAAAGAGDELLLTSSKTPTAEVVEGIARADVVVLALPYLAVSELDQTVKQALNGKIVIDVTNPLTPDYMGLLVGHTTSGAEEIAAVLPKARLVKAFNTVLAPNHSGAPVNGQRLLVPVASDDDAARAVVVDLASRWGFDAVDAGPLNSARYLEASTELLIRFAFAQGMGTGIGLALVRG